MSDNICETVQISAPVTDDNPLGFIVINKTDFAAPMVLYSEPKAQKSDKTKE